MMMIIVVVPFCQVLIATFHLQIICISVLVSGNECVSAHDENTFSGFSVLFFL